MAKIKYVEFLFIVILAFALFSCEEEIEWDAEEVEEMLVVEGSFTNELKHHRVTLTKTAPYFSDKETPAVENADIFITSKSDTITFSESPDEPGEYVTDEITAGETGTTYMLHIDLESPINGQKSYYAKETMVPGLVMTNLDAFIYENPVYVEESDMDSLMLIVTIYGQEPKEIENNYMVKLRKNQEPMHDTISQVGIYTDEQEFEAEYANNLFFFDGFLPGDTLELELSSVTDHFRDYVDGVQKLANQSGNPFDLSGPPANALGNIQGAEAMGYFRVSSVSKSATIIQDGREED